MKKIISLLLVFVLALSCSAIAFAAEEPTPVIVISGMGTAPLVDAESGENAFPPSNETIIKNILKAAPSLAAAALLNDWTIFGEYGAKPVHDLFEKMKCDENGNSVYNIVPTSYEKMKCDESGGNCSAEAHCNEGNLFASRCRKNFVNGCLEVIGNIKSASSEIIIEEICSVPADFFRNCSDNAFFV